MPRPLVFRKGKRRAISELYASMLMIGATVSLGGYLTIAAIGQFGLSSSSASVSAGMEQGTSGKLLSFVYSTTGSSLGCPAYGGTAEGTVVAVNVFDYGTSAFSPSQLVLNGTVYTGVFPTVAPGTSATYQVTLSPAGTCAHASGQTVLLSDASGDEVQFET